MHVISGIGETTGAWGVRVLVATRGVRRPTRGRFVVRWRCWGVLSQSSRVRGYWKIIFIFKTYFNELV